MKDKIGVIVIGASGYGGGELLRLLLNHPQAEIVGITSQSFIGKELTAAHPQFAGFYSGLTFLEKAPLEKLKDYSKSVCILALPHGASGKAAAELFPTLKLQNTKLIDLSGDLRLQDLKKHKEYYPGSAENLELRAQAVYGLPEINKEQIANATIVTNPGCLATAAILSVLPLVHHGFKGNIAFDMKTGSSGSGNDPKEGTHHPTRHSNFWGYKVLAHQHEPEVLQALGDSQSLNLTSSFFTQSMPIVRGIFGSAHLTLTQEIPLAELYELYAKFYKNSPFVRLVKDSPHIQNVVTTNFCDIALAVRGKQVIAMATIDNLTKGMAGQAIQNMNLMFSLPETTGLWAVAPKPV